MKTSSKALESVSRRLMSIESNEFDEDTIKLLLIEIREYIPDKSLLREVADFVAHPERDRGIIFESVNYAFYRSKVILQQFGEGIRLDLENIQPELFHTVRWHYQKIKPQKGVLDYLSKTFKYDRNALVYNPIKKGAEKFSGYLQEAASLIAMQPAIDSMALRIDLIRAIQAIGLDRFTASIENSWNDILICILVILHRSEFLMPDKSKAPSCLSLTPTDNLEAHKINLSATVNPIDGKPRIGFSILETELTGEMYFSDALLDDRFPGAHFKSYKQLNELFLKGKRVNGRIEIDVA